MNIIGIVCEYNPFHKGHSWHIEESRAALGKDSLVVCVMSGDFVQRGEAAVFSKYARAEAACRCGADLVFELPVPWVLSSAEGFARGAVEMLAGLGCTHLSFGSEHGSLDELENLACTLNRTDILERIRQRMTYDPRISFAVARQEVLKEELGQTAQLLDGPNNILAVEYLKTIEQLERPLIPFTVERRGAGHDEKGEGELRSASELREMLRRSEDIGRYIPAEAMEVFSREIGQGRALLNATELELVIMSRLRMLEESAFLNVPDGLNGEGKRLYKQLRICSDMEELFDKVCTKRITRARARRMCLCAALGVKAGTADGCPPYARLLAAGASGREFLRSMKDETTIPVVTKPASIKYFGEKAVNVFAMGASAHDMLNLLYSSRNDKKAGQDWKTGPKIV